MVDTAFGFTAADADSAANTLDDACTVDLNEASVTSVGATLLSSFVTCAVGDGTETAENDFAFCTDINGTGVNYEGVSADYELMVPTSDAMQQQKHITSSLSSTEVVSIFFIFYFYISWKFL